MKAWTGKGRISRRAALVSMAIALAACATEGGPGVRQEPASISLQASLPRAMPASPSASVPAPPSTGLASPEPAPTSPEPAPTSPEPAPDSPAPADLAVLPSKAEEAYRARRFDEAIVLYERLLERQPSNAHGWLRLGNVHHRRRNWFKALAAYRRAAARTLDGVETEAAVRAKAIYNVVLIDLELARQGLRALERLGPAAVSAIGDATPLALEVERTQRALDALPTSGRPAAQAPDASSGARVDAPAPRIRLRRRADGPARVDYIRGEPQP